LLYWLYVQLSLQVLNGNFLTQMIYLEDWAILDRAYSGSLSGATEALKASTLRLPVFGGAKVLSFSFLVYVSQ
jgi:hypothetical protein